MPVALAAEGLELIAMRWDGIAAEWLIRTRSASKQPPTKGGAEGEAEAKQVEAKQVEAKKEAG